VNLWEAIPFDVRKMEAEASDSTTKANGKAAVSELNTDAILETEEPPGGAWNFHDKVSIGLVLSQAPVGRIGACAT
jgi:hypothetical protein